MSELVFDCLDGRAERYAVVPTLVFRLRVAETSGVGIEAIALRCQIRIEAQRRRYEPAEADQLLDLFGEPARWGETLRPLHMANLTAMVPRFTGSIELDLPVPCTYDLEVATTKYFHALEDGEIPLLFLFSGTVFARAKDGFSVEQVPWTKEASYRLPVCVYREMMDLHFPSSGWIRLRQETLAALRRYKARQALTNWDDVLTSLLSAEEEAS
jgi:hypothetical protein